MNTLNSVSQKSGADNAKAIWNQVKTRPRKKIGQFSRLSDGTRRRDLLRDRQAVLFKFKVIEVL
jgi:hypothetical protein